MNPESNMNDRDGALLAENDAGLLRTEPVSHGTQEDEPKKHYRARRHHRRHRRTLGQRFVDFMDNTGYMAARGLRRLWKGIIFLAEHIFKPFVLTCWVGVLLSVVITVLCENETIRNTLGASTAYAVGALLATAGYGVWLSRLVVIRWGFTLKNYAAHYLPCLAVYGILPVLACFMPGRGGMEYGEPVFTYLFLPFKSFHFVYLKLFDWGILDISVPPLTTRLLSSGASALFLLLVSFLSALIFHAVREKKLRG